MAVVTMALVLGASCGPAGSEPASTSEGQAARWVQAVQLIDRLDGVALTGRGLFSTGDAGFSWRDITPHGVSARRISEIMFTSPSSGWALVERPNPGAAVAVYRTTDGGTTWSSTLLGLTNDALGGTGYLAVGGERNGWAIATLTTSSAFSAGLLFRTADAGASWSELHIPIAGQMSFADSRLGVVVDPRGATRAGRPAYETVDGGVHWSRIALEPPPGFSAKDGLANAPTWAGGGGGVLPVTYTRENQTSVAFYRRDARSQWRTAADVPVLSDEGTSVATAVVGDGPWFVAQRGAALTRVTENGEFRTLRAAGLPREGGIAQLSFADARAGWAVAVTSRCRQFKSTCVDRSGLYATTDGGATWSALNVPG